MSWDGKCAADAAILCQQCDQGGGKGCGDPGTGDCCEANGTPSCDDAFCCDFICEVLDPFCCDVQWDQMCADLAAQTCVICQ